VRRRASFPQAAGINPDPSNQCAPYSPPYIFTHPARRADAAVEERDRDALSAGRSNPPRAHECLSSEEGDPVCDGRFRRPLRRRHARHRYGWGQAWDPLPWSSRYGTPQSEAMHLVERYRLIDMADAKAAMEQHQRRAGLRGAAAPFILIIAGFSFAITVEDPKVFTMPWSLRSPTGAPRCLGRNRSAPRHRRVLAGMISAFPKRTSRISEPRTRCIYRSTSDVEISYREIWLCRGACPVAVRGRRSGPNRRHVRHAAESERAAGQFRRQSLSRDSRLGARSRRRKGRGGGSNGVAIDKDGKTVWATDRCSPGTSPGCLGTKANPVHPFRRERQGTRQLRRRHVRVAARHPCR